MDALTSVALSLAQSMRIELDVSASNMANAETSGFKGERVFFESFVQRSQDTEKGEDVHFLSHRGSWIDESVGEVVQTGNMLDVALEGGGWLGYETGDGRIALGRDGRFLVDVDGFLVTARGARVLDEGGAPIALPPEAQAGLAIAGDGTLSIPGGAVIGRLGVFDLPEADGLQRASGAMFVLNPEAGLPAQALSARVVQGAIEKSNIQPVLEMTRMMSLQTAYDRASKLMTDTDELRKNFLQRIGRVA
jgi:flagellar basal-body rod protein FlgF